MKFKSLILTMGIGMALPLQAAIYIVDGSAGNASDQNPGTREKPFKTISAAAVRVTAGDRVVVRPGIYREHVSPAAGGEENAPVVFEAEIPHRAFIRGSEYWNPEWKRLDVAGHVYSTPIPEDSFFNGYPNPLRRRLSIAGKELQRELRPSPLPENSLLPYSLGQLFHKGRRLIQSQTVEEVTRSPGSWIVSEDGKTLLLHFPDEAAPEKDTLELSVRDRVFSPDRRGLRHIVLKGFVLEHAANQGPFPQQGMVSTRSGRSWIIENNIIRHAQTIGLDCGSEYWQGGDLGRTEKSQQKLMVGGNHLICQNQITDNGLCGIAGWNHTGVKILDNILERNNAHSFSLTEASWEEWGAIKLHGATNTLLEGNYIRDNGAHGIWLDNGFVNARITRNVIDGATGTGIFLEMGSTGRCLIDNNVVAHTKTFNLFFDGVGVYAHDAMDLVIAHNTLLENSAAGIRLTRVSSRKFAGKELKCSRNTVMNNLLLNNGGAIELPYPGEYANENKVDYNFIVGNNQYRFPGEFVGGLRTQEALAAIKEKFTDSASQEQIRAAELTHCLVPELWQKATGYDLHSTYLPTYLKEGKFLRSYFYAFIKPYEPSIRFQLEDDTFLNLSCPKIEGIDRDYTSQPIQSPVRPGAFQTLKPKFNYFILHPVP